MNQEPLWVDQKDFAEKISMKLNGVWNEKKKGWNVECPYCPTHEQPRQNKRLRKQAIIREGNSSRKLGGCSCVPFVSAMAEVLLEYH